MPSALNTSQSSPLKGEEEVLPTPFDTHPPSHDFDGAGTLQRPPVSPITPSATFAEVSPSTTSNQKFTEIPPMDDKFIERPESLPIDEDENFDTIALKSAIATLELQKQKARRDILELKQIRDAAVANPEQFKDDMSSGKLAYETKTQNPVQAALEGGDDSDEDDEDGGNVHDVAAAGAKLPRKIPAPQVVVRCPPINWEKYHIVGEPLDRMHEEQRKRPTPGQPWSEEREAIVAAPYNPLKDKAGLQSVSSQLPPPMETRRSYNRKKSGG